MSCVRPKQFAKGRDRSPVHKCMRAVATNSSEHRALVALGWKHDFLRSTKVVTVLNPPSLRPAHEVRAQLADSVGRLLAATSAV